MNQISEKEINLLIKEKNLNNVDNLLRFIKEHRCKYNFYQLSKICEIANSKRQNNAAYYTNQKTCLSIIKDLPSFKGIVNLKILEPSVGCGNFIPFLIDKYKNKMVSIDLLDKDKNSLKILKELIKIIKIPNNVKLNFINADFLLHNFNNKFKYNLIIGNPPFMKITNKELLKNYKKYMFNTKTNNIFSFFIEKALTIGENVAFITPKSLIFSPEYDTTRELLEKRYLKKICDYGETAFNVKIETISFIISNINRLNNKLKIESYITKQIKYKNQNYICSKEFPYWLLYRNKEFDKIKNKLILNIFKAYRDRKITKKHIKHNGKIKVLKSRNLSLNGQIIKIKNYDAYIDNPKISSTYKFMNNKDAIIIPNLSYYPRAAFLPLNSITDGSLAILIPKNEKKITKDQINYFKTEEFKKFYRIAQNYGTRSLNINKNSVFFWGVKK